MTARIDPFEASSGIYKKFLGVSMALDQSAIERPLQELVKIRVSQINGCAFCVDMHVKEATIHQERSLRLHHLAIWRESDLFTARERAGLAWAEALTRLGEHGVTDDVYALARGQFSEEEISDLTFAVMIINGWNRLSIAFQAEPGSKDAAFGLDKAGLN